MKGLNIEVERTGFPITILGINFFFDASVEGLEAYELNYQKAIDGIYAMEESENTLEGRKAILTTTYDTILGEGAFEKIYAKLSDVLALQNYFFKLIVGINAEVQEVVKQQVGVIQEIMDEYEEQDAQIANNQE